MEPAVNDNKGATNAGPELKPYKELAILGNAIAEFNKLTVDNKVLGADDESGALDNDNEPGIEVAEIADEYNTGKALALKELNNDGVNEDNVKDEVNDAELADGALDKKFKLCNEGIKLGADNKADSLIDKPNDINGIPEDAPGNELGNELKPGNEELDHNGPQLGRVDKDNKDDKDEPKGPDEEITKGAVTEVKNGYNKL